MIDRIDICKEAGEWQSCLDLLPGFAGKAYYRYDYLNLLQQNGEGEAMALIYRQNGKMLAFYPVLRKKIPQALSRENGGFDFESPYGYGGPVWVVDTIPAKDQLAKAHHRWCLEQNIVAEFTRFNPLCENAVELAPECRLEKNRTTISINLSCGLQGILERTSASRRRNFKRALKSGLSYSNCNGQDFMRLYQETMNRLGADEYYNFSQKYFSALLSLPNLVVKAAFTPRNELAAAAVFLEDEVCRHYHLGASAWHLRHFRPNDFLMIMAAAEAAEQGQKLLHLGGGLQDSEDDPLFRFKKGFSSERKDFFTGRSIHQPELYRQISALWQQQTRQSPRILLHYHY